MTKIHMKIMSKNIFAVILCLASVLANGATIYVATNGLEVRTGLGDWTNAVLTISNAVTKATAINDLILVSNGEYLLTAQITVSSQITVRSWNNGFQDGGGIGIACNGTIANCQFIGNQAPASYGGGLRLDNSGSYSPIFNSEFRNNYAQNGGG
jgi:hypothetical protein